MKYFIPLLLYLSVITTPSQVAYITNTNFKVQCTRCKSVSYQRPFKIDESFYTPSLEKRVNQFQLWFQCTNLLSCTNQWYVIRNEEVNLVAEQVLSPLPNPPMPITPMPNGDPFQLAFVPKGWQVQYWDISNVTVFNLATWLTNSSHVKVVVLVPPQ